LTVEEKLAFRFHHTGRRRNFTHGPMTIFPSKKIDSPRIGEGTLAVGCDLGL
jgi:hypothetical protein